MELHPMLDTDTSANPSLWYVLATSGESPTMRVGHTCTYIKGKDYAGKEDAGKLYVIGGANPSGMFADTYVLDLNTLQWDTIDATGLRARYEHVAFCAESLPGKIFIFGGADQSGNMNEVQCLDTADNSWSTVAVSGTAPAPRTFHTTAVVKDKLIVYSGGHSGADPVGDRQVHSYDVSTSTWSVLSLRGDSPKPRHGHVMVAIGNRVFVHGGMAGSSFYDDLHVLDLDKNAWSNVKRKKMCPSARAGHSGVADGTDLYIFGGMNRDGALDDMYKLDTVSMVWTKVELQGPPPPSRLDFGMCVINLFRSQNPNQDLSTDIAATSKKAQEVLDTELKPGSASSRDSRQDNGPDLASIGADMELAGAESLEALGEKSKGENSKDPAKEAPAADKKKLTLCLVNGGMDTEGEIFDDTLVILLQGS
ncbi:rab9 effector protein with kelch motifs-like [Haliotis rubra]|uniref:rab9 effector protein with kelch motifs-like n=1 Tax=Haliotis rubra TaxID=36100 RepID=UPI001EE52FCF|nr:rab9 effector protein with kelch motifs-like [Haliotis rubra]XP_046560836.1 rab9 effector protein with kelch motifs-like [Haliotis rubra]XP_046560837.1 rab9 effector protein with kelch motifs-like [Haliotis rubra]XP_046560838.1 rab9 effector protein with kelch motifs-like [Haliotis rubra]XP_046560839.1 rab9 effector protein with kelch motifs-like [Haliotis rubra]XP_046560840.1 rab9 effector protein with kelch motifs-like [Haliotis rubra]